MSAASSGSPPPPSYGRRVFAIGQQRGGFRSTRGATATSSTIELDPSCPHIERAIQRLERKTFLFDGLIPEVQVLLAVPALEAKQAYLTALTQYSLVMMLILASLLGSALQPLDYTGSDSSSDGGGPAVSLPDVYNTLSMVICCASLFGTGALVIEGIIVEGTPEARIHSIIASADALVHFGTNMLALGLQGTGPLIILRAWISSSSSSSTSPSSTSGSGAFTKLQCVVLTAIVVGMQFYMLMTTYFGHLQTHWPVIAQRWTKLFVRPLYKRKESEGAIDSLVHELRYLQQPRDKVLSARQLGEALERYLGVLGGTNAPGAVDGSSGLINLNAQEKQALLAEESDFLQVLEAEAGGRLSPSMERLARKTLEKVVATALDKLADEARARQTPG